MCKGAQTDLVTGKDVVSGRGLTSKIILDKTIFLKKPMLDLSLIQTDFYCLVLVAQALCYLSSKDSSHCSNELLSCLYFHAV